MARPQVGGLRLSGVSRSRVDIPNAAHSRIVRTHSHVVGFVYGRCGGGGASPVGSHTAQAAQALESVRGGIGPGDRLPAPAPGALEGKLRCIR